MKVVILDGRCEEGPCPVLDVLLDELQDRGAGVQTFRLRDMKMGSCISCFNCWLKTPGICVEADEGRNIAQAVMHSDTTILLSPVTFGGYSSEIKKAQDRWIPLILPDFGIYHGEVHHKPRYKRYPRWIGIGIQNQPDEDEAHIFKVLVGRNALNFHAPSYAADVVLTSDSEVSLGEKIQRILEREDAFPLGMAITSLMPGAVAVDVPTHDQELHAPDRPRRALLIVGSPKIGSPSTSGVLGDYVLKQLEEHGWETTSLTLRRNLLKESGQAELLAAAKHADLILLVFPLYIDSLPFLVMKALEVMAKQLGAQSGESPKRIAAIVNNGFPESYQNAPAVAICRRFAVDTGMTWLGGLAMGAGEALFRGQPFEETKRNGPPVVHVKRALGLTASALANGQTIPGEAIRLIRKTPIPIVPFRLWRRLFIITANQHWRRGAAEHQVGSDAMRAQPYTEASGVNAK
jgi:multimeric flavodoxin WrbA